jgi:hypothetical protein
MEEKIIVHQVKQNITLNKDADILGIFDGWKLGDWAVCLHCGQAYRIGEYRLLRGLQMCPYPGCDGDTVMDPVHYSFPEPPERNKIYKLW